MTIKEVSEKYNISADTLRYYEKVGAIPPVTRTATGIRDYSEQDIAWVELAKCMRSAGLPVDVLVEYLKLYKQGDGTIKDRLELLTRQRDILLEQQKQTAATLERLNYKIAHYEEAVKTGKVVWDN
ncbi:MAG: MerR family transcriptional regulator [Clostridia bacterium]|nr:MerR family transcriptional regulator [Clostridia bacterium]